MKIHALVHFALPHRVAGSEIVLHELMAAAARAGHEATIWCTHKDALKTWRGTEPDTQWEGVTVKRVRNSIIGSRRMSQHKPDVVVSHHQHVLMALKAARLINARTVFLLHNDMNLNQRPLEARPDLVIFNSQWVKESLARYGEPKDSLVFYPPLTPDRHMVPETGDAFTLCNVNEHKGARIFYQLAERMPERRFIAVVGGHGQQVIQRLSNVTILPHDPDMKRVWSQTRVLLMPSVYESYGLTAVESGLNGIPTIANATPGLMENIGPGGQFVDWGTRNLPTPYQGNEQAWHREWANPSPDHVQAWVDAVTDLDGNYFHASDYARDRSDEALTATRATLKQWVEWIG